MSDWRATLEGLHGDATARVPDAPSWSYVTERARALTAGSTVLQAMDAVDVVDAAVDVADTAGAYDQVAEALRHQYPTAYPTSAELRALDVSKLGGLRQGAQGGWFELAVQTAFEEGDLEVPAGAVAWEFPESATNPGFDMRLLDADGALLETIQLKATANIGYIRDTLERYPDIPIVATSEVAQQASEAGLGDMVIDSGIPLSEFPGTGALALTAEDFTPFSDEFNLDIDVLDAALFGADALLTTLTGGDVKAAMGQAAIRGGKRIGREVMLNTVAEVAMQATGSAVAGNAVGVIYATYRIGRTGKMVLDFRDQEVGFTTRQVQRYQTVLDGLGSVDSGSEPVSGPHDSDIALRVVSSPDGSAP